MRKFVALLGVLLSAACATTPAAPRKAFVGEHGFELTGTNPEVKACHDFYEFAVGNWRRTHPLPATHPRYGRFEELAERNRTTLRAILEESGRSANQPGSAAQKIGDFYAACMDETAIEAAGATPIRGDLDRIDALDARALAAEVLALHQRGIYPFFRFTAQNDFKNSKQIIAAIAQGGLGLPDRDYYLRDDASFARIREQYVDHIAKMFALAGVPAERAARDARRVLELETQLARASMTRVAARSPENVYHITSVSDLAALAPSLDWNALIRDNKLAGLQSVNVAQPDFLREVNRVLSESPAESVKAYLRWNVIDSAAPALSSAFVNQDFEFRQKTLSGQRELQPRWQRCVRAADASIGQLVGQEYVRRAFTPEAKRKMNELIGNLIAALREGIPQLEWMTAGTQREALLKLNAFQRRIGYPDKWTDYAALDIRRDSYAANAAAARAFSFRSALNRIGKPDDPDEWGFFTPATVNAGYSPARNDIIFPAGILQPPFYDPNADDAYNYGGIGTVIGHEMTHGFDDQGARFDAAGNLRDWWTPEDKKRFEARANCIAEQYGEFVVEEGLNIQGKLVTGEAIADLGGATLALRAYEKSLEGKERKVIDGFTPEQRFFLGFAQVWGENMAAAEARRRALTDVHAQGPFRVNATVANMPEFQRAFNCEAKAPMVRVAEKKCNVW
jgi:predicted metalloendopeptidase